MLPFLYKTRTLSVVPSISTFLGVQSKKVPPFARKFSISSTIHERDRPSQSSYHARDRQPRPPRPSPRGYSNDKQDEIPFDVEGDLINDPFDNLGLDEFGEPNTSMFEGFDGIEDGEDHDGGDQTIGAGSMNLRGPRESTITDSERRAFQNIFAEMFSDDRSSAASGPDVLSPKGNARANLDSILSEALSQNERNKAEKEDIVNRWPGALRPAVAKAIGLTDDAENESNEATEDKEAQAGRDIDELESLREPERKRVETMMREAPTDIELWDVMDREVFSLIPKLGLSETQNEVEGPGERSTKKSKSMKMATGRPTVSVDKNKRQGLPSSGATEADELFKAQAVPRLSNVLDPATGSEIPALAFYGPLYPSYLLLGIRLLDREFSRPSPLALAILSKIKSLGAISHVLGASPSLYNENLRVYLYRYEDFHSIVATMNDMNASAVQQNKETLEIIKEALALRWRVQHGERGPVPQQIWSQMPPWSAVNLTVWKHKIALALKQTR
jgi:hypothetical protein